MHIDATAAEARTILAVAQAGPAVTAADRASMVAATFGRIDGKF